MSAKPEEEQKDTTTQRLFVGLYVPAFEIQAVNSALKKMKQDGQSREMEINWSPAQNWHITLKFLGDVPSTQIPQIDDCLRQGLEGQPQCPVKLEGVGAFPEIQETRVLWLGVKRTQPLIDLQEKVESALSQIGFLSTEDREFVPHLTIGRLRKARNCRDLLSPHQRKSWGKFQASKVILFESRVLGSRPIYTPLHQYELTPLA